MRKIYWRPKQVSRPMLMLISLIAIVGLMAVEHFQITVRQPDYESKLKSAQLARRAMDVILRHRLRSGKQIDPEADPTKSGLIGSLLTVVTSDPGALESKQTTVNPNFAAVVVEMLAEAGVKKGDPIAIGLSGSFPAMNICVLAAATVLELKPVIISSAAASQWGANDPRLLWLDMEAILFADGIFPFRSIAASFGGIEDRGLGMSEEGRQLIRQAIERNELPLISTKTIDENIEKRMSLYHEAAGGKPIRAYINVGGGTVSVGTTVGKRLFRPGLNLFSPRASNTVDSVMSRFSNAGVPVIHMVQIPELAAKYGLPVAPTSMPAVGEGKIFLRREHNRWLAGIVLATILLCLYGFVRSDLGFRLLGSGGAGGDKVSHPEQMV